MSFQLIAMVEEETVGHTLFQFADGFGLCIADQDARTSRPLGCAPAPSLPLGASAERAQQNNYKNITRWRQQYAPDAGPQWLVLGTSGSVNSVQAQENTHRCSLYPKSVGKYEYGFQETRWRVTVLWFIL